MLLCAVFLLSCEEKNTNLPDGLYAEFTTNKGTIITTLEYEKAPVTVANFITLAEGTNTFAADAYKSKAFYDGLTFHRVEQDFMIQGGDPDANGSGGPGYKFKDEITDLKHDKPGTLSMANAGPGTNGSQFFITHVPTPFLDGRHTVFGYVVADGMPVVNAIVVGDVIERVKIIRKGEKAKKFDAVKVFADYIVKDKEETAKQEAIDAENKRIYLEKYATILQEHAGYLKSMKAKAEKTNTGLQYVITQKGPGKTAKPGEMVFISYSGWLENGELFDTSDSAVATKFGKLDENRAAAGAYRKIPFKYGRRDGLIPGFLEGIYKLDPGDKALVFIPAHLGYGPQGAGGVIPPNANLIFEIEMHEAPANQK